MDLLSVASAFVMHVGARNMQLDFTDAQKRLFSMPAARLVILFAMFYVTTRHLIASVALVATYFVTVTVLLNEQHPFNVYTRSWLVSEGLVSPKFAAVGATPYDLYTQNVEAINH